MSPRPCSRLLLVLVSVALLATSCSSSDSGTAAPATTSSSAAAPSQPPGASAAAPNGSASSAPAAAAAAVGIKDFRYTMPASVAPGSEITVTNSDGEAHTFTVAGGPKVIVQGGGTATVKAPAKPGKYAITCDFHGNMHAELIVA